MTYDPVHKDGSVTIPFRLERLTIVACPLGVLACGWIAVMSSSDAGFARIMDTGRGAVLGLFPRQVVALFWGSLALGLALLGLILAWRRWLDKPLATFDPLGITLVVLPRCSRRIAWADVAAVEAAHAFVRLVPKAAAAKRPLVIPTTFGPNRETLLATIRRFRPDLVPPPGRP